MGSFLGGMLGFFGAVGIAMLIREAYEKYARENLRRKIEKAYTDWAPASPAAAWNFEDPSNKIFLILQT